MRDNKKGIIISCLPLALAALFFLTGGILIGWLSTESSRKVWDVAPLAISEISADEIDSSLRYLTTSPHVAGTERDAKLAHWIKNHFNDAGFDEVKVVPYEVLLSYPSSGVPNTVSLIDPQGDVQFKTVGRQPALGSPEETSEEVMLNFNAYSPSGIAKGNLVYAHYGRKKDFEYLISRGINITGNIVLIRIGVTVRGSKVALAEKYGAIGVILFSDRLEKATQDHSDTYPRSWWMPGKGAEYGFVSLPKDGDLLTPLYPAIDGAYRISEEGHPALPKIPVQAIGYEEVEVLLRHLSPEHPAPKNWIGKLDAPYWLGPNFTDPGWKVVLNVSTSNERRTIFNTIGIIHGSTEPDRYVILGNHRDAWAFGALDPSSGTASMLEVARVFGKIKTEKNWQPRRSIVFCSWSASEYGMIGSYEWIQQHAKVLSQRAVAYLNVDAAVSGNRSLRADALPTLKKLIIESSKLVPNPNPDEVSYGHETVFDTWLDHSPDKQDTSQPYVGNLGGGSDFEGFAYVIGVPSTDFGYTSYGTFPTYHSLYDSFYLASELVDRGFVHHQAVARLWAVVALKLADAVVLPLDIEAYAFTIEQSFSEIEVRFGNVVEKNNATFKHVRASVDYFVLSVNTFTNYAMKELDKDDDLAVRRFNDKLMLLERYFIDPHGLPDRPETNHVIFSPSVSELHFSDTFAGLVDLLNKVGNQTAAQDPISWSKIKQHLGVISFLIGEAALSLSEDF